MLVDDIMINKNKIILVTGESGSGKTFFCTKLSKNKKSYMISDSSTFFDKTIVIEELNSIFKYKKVDKDVKNKKIEEVLKMVNLNDDILTKNIFDLSSSEKVKVLLCKILLKNAEIVIIDDIINFLDDKSRTKIFKILIKLKKYYNKTIVISTSNIDLVFEFIDDIIYIIDNKIYKYCDKFSFYSEKDDNIKIKPALIEFVDKIRNKYPSVMYKDSINELIKELYREIR